MFNFNEETYTNMLEELKSKISQENFKKLELFFANTDLSDSQRMELIQIVESIKSEEGKCVCYYD